MSYFDSPHRSLEQWLESAPEEADLATLERLIRGRDGLAPILRGFISEYGRAAKMAVSSGLRVKGREGRRSVTAEWGYSPNHDIRLADRRTTLPFGSLIVKRSVRIDLYDGRHDEAVVHNRQQARFAPFSSGADMADLLSGVDAGRANIVYLNHGPTQVNQFLDITKQLTASLLAANLKPAT